MSKSPDLRSEVTYRSYIAVRLSLGWIGVMLLAILIMTGYRNVLRALRGDPSQGVIGLAFFVTGLLLQPH